MVLFTGSVVVKQGVAEKLLKFSIGRSEDGTSMYGRIESENRVKLPITISNLYEIVTHILKETFPEETYDRVNIF